MAIGSYNFRNVLRSMQCTNAVNGGRIRAGNLVRFPRECLYAANRNTIPTRHAKASWCWRSKNKPVPSLTLTFLYRANFWRPSSENQFSLLGRQKLWRYRKVSVNPSRTGIRGIRRLGSLRLLITNVRANHLLHNKRVFCAEFSALHN